MGLVMAMLIATTFGVPNVAGAQEYRPSFRPAELRDRPAGPPNEVLVLGTPHLSGLPDSFRPEMVGPLVERLVAWRPTAVASENSSGLLCDAMRRQGERQARSVKSYCYDPAVAGMAAGLDVHAANAEAERLLAEWPAAPTAGQRRRLALVFLAAGEPVSAMVQWLRLPTAERRAGDGLTETLATELTENVARKSEDGLIVAQVAARSGLERVWSVDDQSFVGAPIDRAAYGAAIAKAWDNPAGKVRMATIDALTARIGQPDGLTNLYRAFNSPSLVEQAYRHDWGAALTEPSPERYGRRYVGYWETRNLRMVANIRAVLARDPGMRMIAVVGAGHKGYYEAYLDQMRDVRLVDVVPMLK